MKSSFVFIAGAWHGAWCWERVIPPLEAAGHRVLAPDLLGMGDNPTPLAGVTLASWADLVAELVEREADPVILVGHSRGGIVANEVAERVPDRILTLVYVAGSLIPDGGSIMTIVKPDPSAAALLQVREDGSATLPGDVAAALFYNTTPAEWAAAAVARLGPEPLWVHATPLAVTPARFGRVRRAYVETLHDQALPLDTQRSMQAALPCKPVFTLDSDHSPFFSKPNELVDCLLSTAAQALSDGDEPHRNAGPPRD